MKKNVMLKIAAVLLVAVLLTTCAISSTFAKYATSKEADTEQARVAKWGLNVNTDVVTSTFNTQYKNGEVVYVKSSDTDKLVAPGTKGTVTISVTVTGTAEVRANVYITDGTGAEAPYNFVTIADEALAKELLFYTSDSPTTPVSVSTLNGKIKDACKATIEANKSENTTFTYTFDWVWAFEDGADDKDTDLGTKAVTADNIVKVVVQPHVVQDGPAVNGAQNYPA